MTSDFALFIKASVDVVRSLCIQLSGVVCIINVADSLSPDHLTPVLPCSQVAFFIYLISELFNVFCSFIYFVCFVLLWFVYLLFFCIM